MTRMSYNWLSRQGTTDEAHRRTNLDGITRYVYRGGTGYRISETEPTPEEAVEWVEITKGRDHRYVDGRSPSDRAIQAQRKLDVRLPHGFEPRSGPEILDI